MAAYGKNTVYVAGPSGPMGPMGLPGPPGIPGQVNYNPISGQVQVSNGNQWAPTSFGNNRPWQQEPNMYNGEGATTVKFRTIYHSRKLQWLQVVDHTGKPHDHSIDLFWRMKRNALKSIIDVRTYGFNPVNGVNRKFEEIEEFCDKNCTGLWAFDMQEPDYDDIRKNDFIITLFMYFEESTDLETFKKEYLVIQKLSA